MHSSTKRKVHTDVGKRKKPSGETGEGRGRGERRENKKKQTTFTSQRARGRKRKRHMNAKNRTNNQQRTDNALADKVARGATTWTEVQRHGAVHTDVPDYTEPPVATIATLNIAGGGDNSKATMIAPILEDDGIFRHAEGNQVADFLFLTEIKNGQLNHAEFAKRFGGPDTATYWTEHVGLRVHRRFLGHELEVHESQGGRVLQVQFTWYGEKVCLTGLYAPGHTKAKARQLFYRALHVPEDTKVQAILGDFNHVLDVKTDCNNPRGSNTGRKEWGDFSSAYELQLFTDAKNWDHEGEFHPTWEGPQKWGAANNKKRALDRIMISQDVRMVGGSWSVHEPWGTLDHGVVSTQLIAPTQREPTTKDDDIVPTMNVDIIKSKRFQKACDKHIANFNWDIDGRYAMDEFHAECRVSYDACEAAIKDKQYKSLKAANKASKELKGRVPSSTASTEAQQKSEKQTRQKARDAVERAANDLQDARTINECDFSHRSTQQFFQQVNVRTEASSFVFQVPCDTTDDVQPLHPGMRRVGEGGYGVKDNGSEGWTPTLDPTPETKNKERILDQHGMLTNTGTFYQHLFRPRRRHIESHKRIIDAARKQPHFSKSVAASLGAELEEDEIILALGQLQKGKAAGPDGIPSEFYIELGARIAPILKYVGNLVREKGELSPTQRQGHIVLLWKGKHRGDLKYYRPISLVQRLGTVLEMCIAQRLAKAIPSIIKSDQTGYLAKDGRRMHENIVKVMDMLSYSRDKDMSACCIAIDASKAFDRVSRTVLLELYDIACGGEPGSNQPLTMWIKAFLEKQERRVVVNGDLTDAFELRSGVPQGSVLSVLSHVLFSESLANMLHAELKGLRTSSSTARMLTVRYADDLVLLLHPSEVALAMDICDVWNAGSEGLGNAEKTEGMWIGRHWKHDQPWKRTDNTQSPGDSNYDGDNVKDSRLTWLKPGSSLRVLGVMVGYSINPRDIWSKVAKNMFTQMRLWQLAKLSLLARVLVLKVMVWSRAFFVAAYYEPPTDIMALLMRATRCFMQRGALPRGVSVDTPLRDLKVTGIFTGPEVVTSKTSGGLTMWSPACHIKAIAAKWIVLLLEPQKEEQVGDTIVKWTTLGRYYITEYTSTQRDTERSAYYLVDGKLKRPTKLNTILPTFWRYALQAWYDARNKASIEQPSNAAEVASMPLWRNVLVQKGTTTPPNKWMGCDIRRVRDLWDVDLRTFRTAAQMRSRALQAGATRSDAATITSDKLANCQKSLPKAWLQLLCQDTPIKAGELLAERGYTIDARGQEYSVGQVWEAYRQDNIRGVWWKRWNGQNSKLLSSAIKVKRGAGPAGKPAPLHPITKRKIVIYTDGGCVENASVNIGDQLAGAGCAVLNAEQDGIDIGIYCPVITDPTHKHYLGATRGTNNTAEVSAIGEALIHLRDYDTSHDDAHVYVDSKYAPAVVEARWGFKSNVKLIQCIQRILVQVRAKRNVSFFWVKGHSKDRWNDAADDLATLGQHLDVRVRSSCTTGRHASHATPSTLECDPRTVMESQDETKSRGFTAMSDMPLVYRVQRDTQGDVVGFADICYADMVSRVQWNVTPHRQENASQASFSIKKVRTALSNVQTPTSGVNASALQVARACPQELALQWHSVWKQGWGAPWHERVKDMWWLMASGAQYVACNRRHHDPSTAFCRVCETHCDNIALDTHKHVFYDCPGHRPLWAWTDSMLKAIPGGGAKTFHSAAFMLYGTQVLQDTDGSKFSGLGTKARAVHILRGTVVEAFRTARAGTMTPDATAVHPSVSTKHARSILKEHIMLDWREATRDKRSNRGQRTHVQEPASGRQHRRPRGIGAFRAQWGWICRISTTGVFKWLHI